MPLFIFRSPEGIEYEVEGPGDATQEDAWGVLQGYLDGQARKRGQEITMARAGKGSALGLAPTTSPIDGGWGRGFAMADAGKASSPARSPFSEPLGSYRESDPDTPSSARGVLSDIATSLKIGSQRMALSLDEVVDQIPVWGTLRHKVDEAVAGALGAPTIKQARAQIKRELKAAEEEERSPEMQAALKKLWFDEQAWKFGDAWGDWRAYAGLIFESLPAEVATLAISSRLGLGAYKRVLARTGDKVKAIAAALGTSTLAGRIGEGLLAGGHSAQEVRDTITGLPDEVLLRSEAVRELMGQGLSLDEARKRLAESQATQAFYLAGVATGAFSGYGDRALMGAILRKGGGPIRRFFTGAVAEGALEEFPQEYLSKVAENISIRAADPSREPTAGALNTAFGGLAAGTVQGGTQNVLFGRSASPADATTDTTPIPASDVLGTPEAEQAAQPSPDVQPPRPLPITTEDQQSGAPIANWEAILERARAKPEIYNIIEQVIAEQPSPPEHKAQALDALQEMLADPKAIFEKYTAKPEVYNTIAKAVEDTAKVMEMEGGQAMPRLAPQPPAPTKSFAESLAEWSATYERVLENPTEVDTDTLRQLSLSPIREHVDAAAEELERRQGEVVERTRLEDEGGIAANRPLYPEKGPEVFTRALQNPRGLSNEALGQIAERGSQIQRRAAQTELARRREEVAERTRLEGEGGRALDRTLYSREAAFQRLREAGARQRRPFIPERVNDADVPVPLRNAARLIANSFGKQVVFFSADVGRAGAGTMLPSDNNTLYINVRANVSWRRVIGHEVLHTLRRTNRKVYDALAARIDAAVKSGALDRYRRDYADFDPDIQREEMVADIFGDMMDSPMFWLEVFRATEKSKVRAFVRSVQMVLDILRMRLRIGERRANVEGYETRKIIADIEAVRKAVARAYADWQREADEAAEAAMSPRGEGGAAVPLLSRLPKPSFKEFIASLPKRKDGGIIGSGSLARDDIWKLVRQLIADARAGEKSRDWYRASAKAIVRAFGGNKVAAERFVQLLAITSARSDVQANFTFAEKALIQYARGEPIRVGTKTIDEKLNDLLYFGVNWEGRKTNNFYRTIMSHIDGLSPDEAVVDMHHATVVLGRKKVTASEYAFIDRIHKFVAARLDWPLSETQAAMWVTAKARALLQRYERNGLHKDKSQAEKRRHALARAAVHYGDMVTARWGEAGAPVMITETGEQVAARGLHLTAEVKPSTKLDIGKAVAHLSMARAQAYQKKALAYVFGPKGPAALLEAFGLDRTQYRIVEGSGGYDDAIAPNLIITLNTSKDIARIVALAWMYIFRQDAVPYFRADPALAEDPNAAQGVKIVFSDKLTIPRLRRVFDVLRAEVHPGIGFTRTRENEIVVINFRDENGKPFLMPDNDFLNLLMGAIGKGAFGIGVESHHRFGAETEYPYHDWTENQDGQGLLSTAAGGRPDLQGRLDHWADLFRRFATGRAPDTGRTPDAGAGGRILFSRPPDRGRDSGGAGQDEEAGLREDRTGLRGVGDARAGWQALGERVAEGYVTPTEDDGPFVSIGPQRPTAVAVVGYHYGASQGLTELHGDRFGTGAKSEESRRGVQIKRRVYFYPQKERGKIPQAEGVVGLTAKGLYRATLANIYDTWADPSIVNAVKARNGGRLNAEAFERAVVEAGYDGYLARYHHTDGAVVLLDVDRVPVQERPLLLFSRPYAHYLNEAVKTYNQAKSEAERLKAQDAYVPVLAPHHFQGKTSLQRIPRFLFNLKRKNGSPALVDGPIVGKVATLYLKPAAEHRTAQPGRTAIPRDIVEDIDNLLQDPLYVFDRADKGLSFIIGRLPAKEYISVGIDRVRTPQGEHNFIATIGPRNEESVEQWKKNGIMIYKRPTTVDQAAQTAATSPTNDAPEPTAAQKQAGNYAKGHVRIAGMDITIENPAGTRRNPDWPPMPAHYGYIRGTKDRTGEQIDVFVRPGTENDYSGPAVVVDINRPSSRRFNEYKVMFGWTDPREALSVLRNSYTPDVRGNVVRSARVFKNPDEFKRFLDGGDTQAPSADQQLLFSRQGRREEVVWAATPEYGEWVSVTGNGRYVLSPDIGGWWAVVDEEPLRWFDRRADAIEAVNAYLRRDIENGVVTNPNDALVVTRQYSEGEVQRVVKGWRLIATSPLAFRTPRSSSRDLATVFAELDTKRVVREVLVGSRSQRNVTYEVHFRDDMVAFVNVEHGTKTAYIDAADLAAGSRAGSILYPAVFAWAYNNRIKVVPDPAGLTRINTYRRTEQMLSAALKHGSTSMLSPHSGQGLFGWIEKPRSKADHDKNIAIMALTAMQNTFRVLPFLDEFRYNFEERQFEQVDDSGNATPVTKEALDEIAGRPEARRYGIGRTTIARAIFTKSLLRGEPGVMAFLSGDIAPSLLVASSADDQTIMLYSRPGTSQPSAAKKAAAKVGKAVITATAPVRGVLDAATMVVEGVARVPGQLLQPITSRIYDRVTGATRHFFKGGAIRQQIAHGLVADYGLPEPYIERRDERDIAIQRHLRKAQSMIDRIASLNDAEIRVAYQWMQEKPDTAEEQRLLDMLPEGSINVLAEMKEFISRLGKEAVELGLLSEETYNRNNMAYIHRTYEKFVVENPEALARLNAAKAIRAETFRMRGLRDDVAAIHVPGATKGAYYVRLELREPSQDGGLGKLRRVMYLPAGRPIPDAYRGWRNDGVWEARFGTFDGKGDVGMWRDLTAEERERLGEIRDVRYAFALTTISMVQDIETARFLRWVKDNYSVANADEVAKRGGRVAEASDSMITLQTYADDEWVQVPSTMARGTRLYKYGDLQGQYIPGHIWNDIRATINFRAGSAVWRLHDDLLRAWKISKTALSPAVHTNNVMANFVFAYLVDVGHKDLADALYLILDATDGNADARAMMERYLGSGAELGIPAIHELRRDVIKPVLDKLRGEQDGLLAQLSLIQIISLAARGNVRQALAALSTRTSIRIAKKPFEVMMDAYQLEDSVFRLAKWLKEVRAGADDKAAGRAAREAFLDYRINAPWIQALRQGPFPFLAFTYRAVPRLADAFAYTPWKMMTLMVAGYAVNALGYAILGLGGEDEDRERALLPEEKSGYTILGVPRLLRMPWNDKHGSPVFLDIRRWIPGGDLFDVAGSHGAIPMPQWLSFGGFWALGVEMASNKSQFTGKPIWKESDTLTERAAKVIDHVFKFFAPNLPVPNPLGYALDAATVERGLLQTYSWRNIQAAGSGMTDPFGRELDLKQALASSVGVKVGSYPHDQAVRNLLFKRDLELRDNAETTSRYKREYQRGGLTLEEFNERLQKQREKELAIRRRYAEKLGLDAARQ